MIVSMLTKLHLRNFKRFDEATIELGKAVVFIGPNNSGKTTALQSLALWDIGVRSWNAKRKGGSPEKRPGVTVNRRDLVSIPVPVSTLLWRDLHVRTGQKNDKGVMGTSNIRINVTVEGITQDKAWICGFEFDYSNEESFICRPLRLSGFDGVKVSDAKFSDVPSEAEMVKVAYLPPMSGLADREFIKQVGEIGFLIGQGQTAQVLRNICYQIWSPEDKSNWREMIAHLKSLFGIDLKPPSLVPQRAEITMEYYEQGGVCLDLSSSGRGLQQTLLLLAHLYANPHTVLMLDEPDAHLEILRQRQIFRLLMEVAEKQGSQIIAASHSEVVLAEAAGVGRVVAFVGKPHTLNDRGTQLTKSLTDIGWDQYYQAEETGWVLYLEGATDLAILKTFARRLKHQAAQDLEKTFVHYISTNLPQRARDHFFGLREAMPNLVGVAIFDRIKLEETPESPLTVRSFKKREIENYLCFEEVLLAYARKHQSQDLFGLAEVAKREQAMRESINEVQAALETLSKPGPWSDDIKVTDDFLEPVFKKFFLKLHLPMEFRKSDYHELAELVPLDRIDSEITEKLNEIVRVAMKARPRI